MLANETIVNASGWASLDVKDNDEANQDRLDFSHKVARVFGTSEGKEVLDALVKSYLVVGYSSNDTHQTYREIGRGDVVRKILAEIEISSK